MLLSDILLNCCHKLQRSEGLEAQLVNRRQNVFLIVLQSNPTFPFVFDGIIYSTLSIQQYTCQNMTRENIA